MRYWCSGPRLDGVCRRRPALGSWCFGVDSADFFGGLARVSAASPRSWVLTVLSSWRVGSRPAQRLRRRWRGRGVVGVVAPVPLLTLSRSQVGEQKKNAGIRDAPSFFFAHVAPGCICRCPQCSWATGVFSPGRCRGVCLCSRYRFFGGMCLGKKVGALSGVPAAPSVPPLRSFGGDGENEGNKKGAWRIPGRYL